MVYFLLICIAAILESVCHWWIPYIEKKIKIKIIQPPAIRKYSFLILFCTLLNPELELQK